MTAVAGLPVWAERLAPYVCTVCLPTGSGATFGPLYREGLSPGDPSSLLRPWSVLLLSFIACSYAVVRVLYARIAGPVNPAEVVVLYTFGSCATAPAAVSYAIAH
jgi:hypothetical protein